MAPAATFWAAILGLTACSEAAKVNFSLNLSWKRGAPNGVERDMIFVNDAFPGPPLIMDEGDEVTVSSY